MLANMGMLGEHGRGGESVLIGGGWIRPGIFGLVAIFLLIAVGAGVARWETVPDSGAVTGLYGALGVAVASIFAVLLVSAFFSFVREVNLSADDVEFVTGRYGIRVRWADLVPPTSPYFLGINFRYRVGGSVQERDPQFVTRAQARAILEHPSHPNWVVSEAVRRLLGMAGA